MPVLTNTSKYPQPAINVNNKREMVQPGGTINSYIFPKAGSPFEVTNPDLYVWNDLISITEVEMAAETPVPIEVDIDEEADYIVVSDISGTLDIYRQNTSSTTEFTDVTSGTVTIKAARTMSKLVISGGASETCKVKQYRDFDLLNRDDEWGSRV